MCCTRCSRYVAVVVSVSMCGEVAVRYRVFYCVVVHCSVLQYLCLWVCVESSSLLQGVLLCCSPLQCVAVCCSSCVCGYVWGGSSVLQCVTLCCSALQVCCSVLHCVAVCCSVLQCVAFCCNVLPMLHCVCWYVMCLFEHQKYVLTYICHVPFACAARIIPICHDSSVCVTFLVHMCDMPVHIFKKKIEMKSGRSTLSLLEQDPLEEVK